MKLLKFPFCQHSINVTMKYTFCILFVIWIEQHQKSAEFSKTQDKYTNVDITNDKL